MNNEPFSLSRREALKRVISVSVALTAMELNAFAATPLRGIGTDPNLLKKEIPWPLILSDAEKRIVSALADVIIPADEHGPAASKVGVMEFIDEWVSAPYEAQEKDRAAIQKGLAWIEEESKKRFGKGFADAAAEQHTALLDDIVKTDTDAHKKGYDFFKLFRDRAAGGYYSTPEGWKAIGYVGNLPMAEFPAPPPEVLKHLGLA